MVVLDDPKSVLERMKAVRQVEAGVLEEDCLTGLSGEDKEVMEEVAKDIHEQAVKALQENERGVLDEFDRLMTEDGLSMKEEMERLARQRRDTALIAASGGGGDAASVQVRELLNRKVVEVEEVVGAEVIDCGSGSARLGRYSENRGTVNQQVHDRRQRDRKGKVFGFRVFGQYAADTEVARAAFEGHTERKERWQVVALVMLRDAGVCRVCSEQVRGNGHVKRLIPRVLDGQFSEVNCVLVCNECNLAWPRKNYFRSERVEYHFWEMCMAIMTRRMDGRSGSKPLSEKGMTRRDEVRRNIERATVELHRAMKKIEDEQERTKGMPQLLIV